MILQSGELAALRPELSALGAIAAADDAARERVKTLDASLRDFDGVDAIRAKLRETGYALARSDGAAAARALLREAGALLEDEIAWRNAAAPLLPELARYDDAVKTTIGLRLQKRLNDEQAKDIAACQSAHRDISLAF